MKKNRRREDRRRERKHRRLDEWGLRKFCEEKKHFSLPENDFLSEARNWISPILKNDNFSSCHF